MFPLVAFAIFAVICKPFVANAQRGTPPPSEGVINTPPSGCDCNATSQYNPVCGSDSNTYSSMQILLCYQQCGFDELRVRKIGICMRRKDVPT